MEKGNMVEILGGEHKGKLREVVDVITHNKVQKPYYVVQVSNREGVFDGDQLKVVADKTPKGPWWWLKC